MLKDGGRYTAVTTNPNANNYIRGKGELPSVVFL